MKHIALIYEDEVELSKRFARASQTRGYDFSAYSINSLNPDKLTFDSETVIFSRFDSFMITRKPIWSKIVSVIRNSGAKLLNLEAMERFPELSDKYVQYLRFKAEGIPQVMTEKLESFEMEKTSFATNPIILKKRLGSMGRGSRIIYSREDYVRAMQELNVKDYIVQPMMNVTKDLRVLVMGETILGCVKRRVIIHKDGHVGVRVDKKVKIGDRERELAIKATKALKLDIAGVDLLSDNKFRWICEVNVSPRFAGYERVTGLDFVEKMVENLQINNKLMI